MKALLAVLPALALSACAYHHEEHKLAPAVTRTAPLTAGRRDVLPGARVGSRIRFFPAGQPLVQGSLLRVDSTLVVVGTSRDSIAIPLQLLDSAAVYRGRSTTGAVIGAGIVGALGALFIGGLAAGLCDTSDCETTQAAAAGGVLGIIAGGSIGALVGWAASDWQTVYRARPSR